MAEGPVCPETGLAMSRGVQTLIISYQGRSRMVDMPGWYCEASSESLHTADDMKISDLALVTLKAEARDLATPDEVRPSQASGSLTGRPAEPTGVA